MVLGKKTSNKKTNVNVGGTYNNKDLSFAALAVKKNKVKRI